MRTKEADPRWQDTAGSGRVLRLSIIELLGLSFAAETVADDERFIGQTLRACSHQGSVTGTGFRSLVMAAPTESACTASMSRIWPNSLLDISRFAIL
jgi:hypothetical protein